MTDEELQQLSERVDALANDLRAQGENPQSYTNGPAGPWVLEQQEQPFVADEDVRQTYEEVIAKITPTAQEGAKEIASNAVANNLANTQPGTLNYARVVAPVEQSLRSNLVMSAQQQVLANALNNAQNEAQTAFNEAQRAYEERLRRQYITNDIESAITRAESTVDELRTSEYGSRLEDSVNNLNSATEDYKVYENAVIDENGNIVDGGLEGIANNNNSAIEERSTSVDVNGDVIAEDAVTSSPVSDRTSRESQPTYGVPYAPEIVSGGRTKDTPETRQRLALIEANVLERYRREADKCSDATVKSINCQNATKIVSALENSPSWGKGELLAAPEIGPDGRSIDTILEKYQSILGFDITGD